MKLDELKKRYEILRKKHSLPEFIELNKLFEIEKIDKESDLLLRDVRKVMMDKILEHLRLVEMLINPSIAPPMFLQFVRKVSFDERKIFEKVYVKLILIELVALELEIAYEEEKEAAMIKNILNTWKELIPDMNSIIKIMRRNFEGTSEKKDKSYLG